jgi:hypothetical protein
LRERRSSSRNGYSEGADRGVDYYGALLFGVDSVVAAAAVRTSRVVTAVFILTIITAPVYIPVGLLVYGLAF